MLPQYSLATKEITAELELMANFISHRNKGIQLIQRSQRVAEPWMLNLENRGITRAYRQLLRTIEESLYQCNDPNKYYNEVLPSVERAVKQTRAMLARQSN